MFGYSVVVASIILVFTLTAVSALDLSNSGNMVAYWGQNSAGVAYPGDRSKWEKPLADYCQDDTYDIIAMAFMSSFPDIQLNFAYHCDDPKDCAQIKNDIKFCQSKGKKVTLSMGGATGGYGLDSNQQGKQFADTVWDRFLGGQASDRPFGDAVLDGIDLDIEAGASVGYTAFTERLHEHMLQDKSKQYIISAAPQCPYPDASLGNVLDNGWVDLVYIQFYNNYCGLNHPDQFNYDTWADWATTKAKNPNVKLFIGAPAAPQDAGQGYVGPDELIRIHSTVQSHSPGTLGGVMLWEDSLARDNNHFGAHIAKGIRQGSSSGDNHDNSNQGEPNPPLSQSEETTSSAESSLAPATSSSAPHTQAPQPTSTMPQPETSSKPAPTFSATTEPTSSEPSPVSSAPEWTDMTSTTSAKVPYTIPEPTISSTSSIPEPTISSTSSTPAEPTSTSSATPIASSLTPIPPQPVMPTSTAESAMPSPSQSEPDSAASVTVETMAHSSTVPEATTTEAASTPAATQAPSQVFLTEPFTSTLPNGQRMLVVPTIEDATFTVLGSSTSTVYAPY